MLLENDKQRRDFLRALDESDEVEVSDWEAGAIESFLARMFYTEKQKVIIDRLFKKYDSRIK